MQHKSGRYPRGSGRFFVSWAMIGRASALPGKWAVERTGRQAGVPGGPCFCRRQGSLATDNQERIAELDEGASAQEGVGVSHVLDLLEGVGV